MKKNIFLIFLYVISPAEASNKCSTKIAQAAINYKVSSTQLKQNYDGLIPYKMPEIIGETLQDKLLTACLFTNAEMLKEAAKELQITPKNRKITTPIECTIRVYRSLPNFLILQDKKLTTSLKKKHNITVRVTPRIMFWIGVSSRLLLPVLSTMVKEYRASQETEKSFEQYLRENMNTLIISPDFLEATKNLLDVERQALAVLDKFDSKQNVQNECQECLKIVRHHLRVFARTMRVGNSSVAFSHLKK